MFTSPHTRRLVGPSFQELFGRLTQCGGLRLRPGTRCRGERRRGGAGPCSLADIGKLSVDNFEHHGWAITLSCPFPSGGYASHQIGKPFASVSPQTLNVMRVQKEEFVGGIRLDRRTNLHLPSSTTWVHSISLLARRCCADSVPKLIRSQPFDALNVPGRVRPTQALLRIRGQNSIL